MGEHVHAYRYQVDANMGSSTTVRCECGKWLHVSTYIEWLQRDLAAAQERERVMRAIVEAARAIIDDGWPVPLPDAVAPPAEELTPNDLLAVSQLLDDYVETHYREYANEREVRDLVARVRALAEKARR